MEFQEVMTKLEEWGNAQTKKVLVRHGAKEPFYGVKVADLKTIVKKVKKDHELALQLFKTGNSDAMYLGGLIADETKITKAELQEWVEAAYWYYLSDYAVSAVCAESEHGWEMGLKWIENTENEFITSAGWATLSGMASIKPTEELDLKKYAELLERVGNTVHQAENRVRYTMNNFVISVGSYLPPLLDQAKAVADKIGKVEVFMGETSCKVPVATDYIIKMEGKGQIGKKRKVARC